MKLEWVTIDSESSNSVTVRCRSSAAVLRAEWKGDGGNNDTLHVYAIGGQFGFGEDRMGQDEILKVVGCWEQNELFELLDIVRWKRINPHILAKEGYTRAS